MSESSEKSWLGPFLCGLVLGTGLAGVICKEAILPALVKEKTDFIHHSAAAMDLGYYELDKVTGEVRFIWKVPDAPAPVKVNGEWIIPAPDPVNADELYCPKKGGE